MFNMNTIPLKNICYAVFWYTNVYIRIITVYLEMIVSLDLLL